MAKSSGHKIVECQKCKKLAKVSTRSSADIIFQVRCWTDGKVITSGGPSERPKITKCSGCNQYFWISDARVIGELPFSAKHRLNYLTKLGDKVSEAEWLEAEQKDTIVPKEWWDAEPVRRLSQKEYLEAISLSVFSGRQQELALRKMAWWARNDRLRLPSESPLYKPGAIPFQSPKSKANLECLALDFGLLVGQNKTPEDVTLGCLIGIFNYYLTFFRLND